jgi:hypothetical protein
MHFRDGKLLASSLCETLVFFQGRGNLPVNEGIASLWINQPGFAMTRQRIL